MCTLTKSYIEMSDLKINIGKDREQSTEEEQGQVVPRAGKAVVAALLPQPAPYPRQGEEINDEKTPFSISKRSASVSK